MTGHSDRHQLVRAAVEHWWLTADPARLDPDAAADLIEMYLASSGYAIKPAPRRGRAEQAAGLLLTLAVAAGALVLAVRGEWPMAIVGAALAWGFASDTVRRHLP